MQGFGLGASSENERTLGASRAPGSGSKPSRYHLLSLSVTDPEGLGATGNSRGGKFDLIIKIEKDLNKVIRKIKNTSKFNQKIKEQHAGAQSSLENSAVLDLKSELCALKNKQLQQEQKRRDEVSQKNLQISQLEMKFKAEQQRRLEDGEKKQKVIEELEKDIEITLQSQI